MTRDIRKDYTTPNNKLVTSVNAIQLNFKIVFYCVEKGKRMCEPLLFILSFFVRIISKKAIILKQNDGQTLFWWK